jgi:hypothetical protein
MKRGIGLLNSSRLVVLIAASSSCSPGSAAQAIAPKPLTYGQASGAPTVGVGASSSEPLIVDWDPEQRADLEVLVNSGIAVVANENGGLRLLKGCAVSGTYGFKGVTRKERVIHIENTDELRANLPLMGVARLGGEVSRGQHLDVALVIVGKRISSRLAVFRDLLKGDCGGATHFVRAATMGAFAMSVGSSARVQTVADIFAASAGASSSAKSVARTRDGDLVTCQGSHASDLEPRDQCGALLRIELSPIDTAMKVVDDLAVSSRCPSGFVWKDDKCTTKVGPHLCTSVEVADCMGQCENGDVESCGVLAELHQAGKTRTLPPDELAKTARLLDKACEDGSAAACFVRGATTQFPSDGSWKSANFAEVERLYQRACDLGDLRACNNMSVMLEKGQGRPKDEARARALYSQACTAGWPLACKNLGRCLRDAVGGLADPAQSLVAYRRSASLASDACESGVAETCATLGDLYRTGDEGVPRDPVRANQLLQRACNNGYPAACSQIEGSR